MNQAWQDFGLILLALSPKTTTVLVLTGEKGAAFIGIFHQLNLSAMSPSTASSNSETLCPKKIEMIHFIIGGVQV
ncbi:MAG: hypothetical protein HUJ51_02330 [Eggerthellaceae bacterium]|nr:hypothetical protein [Eggerthellaceae bacterium]